nr:hypothetical protein [Candidatus Magnetobacterium casensis]
MQQWSLDGNTIVKGIVKGAFDVGDCLATTVWIATIIGLAHPNNKIVYTLPVGISGGIAQQQVVSTRQE